VVGYAFPFVRAIFFQPDLSFVDQLLQQDGMMDDFVLSAELGIFILEDIENSNYMPSLFQCLPK